MEQEFSDISIKAIFTEYTQLSIIVKKIRKCNEELLNENKGLKNDINQLSEKLRENLNRDLNDGSVHMLYIDIKEKYDILLKEIENVKQEKEILMKHYEEKILVYKNEIEKEKLNAHLKEVEFNDKFQIHQASIDFEKDDIESRWQTRLNIVNQQLKDSNMTCTILRNQLLDVKNRFSCSNTESDKRIQELEQALAVAEEKLRKTQFINNSHSGVQTFRGSNKLNLCVKNKSYHAPREFRNCSFDNYILQTKGNSSPKHLQPLEVNISKSGLSKVDSVIDNNLDTSPRRLKKRKLYSVEDSS